MIFCVYHSYISFLVYRAKTKELVSLLGERDFETCEYKEEIAENSFGQLTSEIIDFMNILSLLRTV